MKKMQVTTSGIFNEVDIFDRVRVMEMVLCTGKRTLP
jgi:hypothetical protein